MNETPALGVDRLYEAYASKIQTFVGAGPLARDPETARELVQTTFLRAWEHRATLAGMRCEAAQRAWLYRVAARLVIDHLRRCGHAATPIAFSHLSHRIRADGTVDILGDRLDELAAPVWTATISVEDDVLLRLTVEEALRTLPPGQRQLLRLGLAGYTTAEVAEMTRACGRAKYPSPAAIKMHRSRAYARLRTAWVRGAGEGEGAHG